MRNASRGVGDLASAVPRLSPTEPDQANHSQHRLDGCDRGLPGRRTEYAGDGGASEEHACHIPSGVDGEGLVEGQGRPQQTAGEYSIVDPGILHDGRNQRLLMSTPFSLCRFLCLVRFPWESRQFLAYDLEQDRKRSREQFKRHEQGVNRRDDEQEAFD